MQYIYIYKFTHTYIHITHTHTPHTHRQCLSMLISGGASRRPHPFLGLRVCVYGGRSCAKGTRAKGTRVYKEPHFCKALLHKKPDNFDAQGHARRSVLHTLQVATQTIKTMVGRKRERKFIIRQPPIGETDDYDSSYRSNLYFLSLRDSPLYGSETKQLWPPVLVFFSIW